MYNMARRHVSDTMLTTYQHLKLICDKVIKCVNCVIVTVIRKKHHRIRMILFLHVFTEALQEKFKILYL